MYTLAEIICWKKCFTTERIDGMNKIDRTYKYLSTNELGVADFSCIYDSAWK
jgi:hypothetical protein